jgi:hypothetical protein
VSGNGSFSSPYASLGKAASISIAGSGDIIHIVAGTYIQLTQAIIPVGVSIEGEGTASHIKLRYNLAGLGSNAFYQGSIQMYSPSEGTDGNQTISNIWLDGDNYTSFQGVLVRNRSNVTFSNVTFTQFQVTALHFATRASEPPGTEPVTYSQNNKVINCTFTDCNDRPIQAANSVACGSITLEGQDGLIIDSTTLININKPQGHNGDLVAAIQGFFKNCQFTHLTMQKPADEGTSFNFGFEVWYDRGNNEFAYNTYTGGGNAIDIGYGGANKGIYAYSWWIHHNTFTNPALLTSNSLQPIWSHAIQFESSTKIDHLPQNSSDGDAIIEYNYCHNMGTLLTIAMNNYVADTIGNLTIRYNWGDAFGYANNTYGGVIYAAITNATSISNLNIYNNTFVSTTGVGTEKGFIFLDHSVGVIENINITNNIFVGSNGYGYLVFRGSVACDKVNSTYNIIYQNAFTNNPYYFAGTPTPTNSDLITGNLKVDPQFINSIDFHLAAGSPGLTGGLNPPNTYIGAFGPGKTTPTATWVPDSLTYGDLLGASQLSSSWSVAGTKIYTPPSGTNMGSVGPKNLHVDFYPTDTATYTNATKDVTLNVIPKTLTGIVSDTIVTYNGLFQQPTLTTSPIVAYSVTLDGVGGGKKDAASYAYIIGVTDGNYSMPLKTGTFTINKKPTTITASNATFNDDGLTHTITGSTPEGLTLTYEFPDGTPDHVGTFTEIIKLDHINYVATPDTVTITIVTNAAPIFISDTTKIYNGFSQDVIVTSDYPYDITYSPTTHVDANEYNVIVHINDGVHTGDDTATLTILPKPAVLSWATPGAIKDGTALTTQLNASADIDGAWSYNYPAGTIMRVRTGEQQSLYTLTGTFTPTSSNYSGGTVSVDIIVYGSPFLNYILTDTYFKNTTQ